MKQQQTGKDKSSVKWWDNINEQMEKIVFECCEVKYSLTDNYEKVDYDKKLNTKSNWMELKQNESNERKENKKNSDVIYDELKSDYIVAFRCVVENFISGKRGQPSEIFNIFGM